MISSLPFAFFTLLPAAIAAPFQHEERTTREVLAVYDPKITSTTAQTVWVVGNTYDVTWDVSSLPPVDNITDVVGMVVLGQFSGNGEKLYTDSPLATGFLLTDAQVSITVPDVLDGDYMIVLFGDSGTTSPQFKIVSNPLSSLFGATSTSSLSGSATSRATTSSSSSSTSSSSSSTTASNARMTSGSSTIAASSQSSSSSSSSAGLASPSLASSLSTPTAPLTTSFSVLSLGSPAARLSPSKTLPASSRPPPSARAASSSNASAAQVKRLSTIVVGFSVPALATLLAL